MATTMDYSDHKEQFQPMPNIDEELKYEVPPLNIDINNKGDENRKRRFSVSAESSDDKKSQFLKKIYPKSDAELIGIKQSIKGVFLFKGLGKEEKKLLIDAMFDKKCKKGEEIISQQDKGDYFYVIEKGKYEVYKSENKNNPSNDAKLVFTYDNKGAFGELALMYNAPRAATVKAVTDDGLLWAVDRQTFRHIIVGCTARKRKKYDNFLKDVPLLMNTSDETRSAIADVLTQIYPKPDKENDEEKEKKRKKDQPEYIIEQGDDAEHFYFVQDGKCKVTLNGKNKTVRHLVKGDYFGEKAFISGCPRSANVIVEDDKTIICGMDKAAFMRLLHGPLYDKFIPKIQDVYEDDDNDPYKQDDGNLSDIGTTYN